MAKVYIVLLKPDLDYRQLSRASIDDGHYLVYNFLELIVHTCTHTTNYIYTYRARVRQI